MDHPPEALREIHELAIERIANRQDIAGSTENAFLIGSIPPGEAEKGAGARSGVVAGEPGGRAFDIAVATFLLVFVAPLLAACAVAVALTGPGPLLFRQARIGRDGKAFTCLKFRTMVPDAQLIVHSILQSDASAREQWESVQKLRSDPRVTAAGRFMRRYCLDELPQLFNVLAGEMSIVGPRPIVASEIRRYGARFADYCSVKPGLTGLWQVSGRHALSYDERVRLDVEYVRSKSVRADLTILWKTVPVVLFGANI